jgi:ferritin-like metal-binding protein YciE
MAATSLQDLYNQKLLLMLDAEEQSLGAMPQLARRVHDTELRRALEHHRSQTGGHVERLQQLIKSHRLRDQSAQNTECISMRALIEEAQRMLPNIEEPDPTDAFIIGAEQAIEHHEIADYGTARAWARRLQLTEDVKLLQQTLDEERLADKTLTTIAEQIVNEEAAHPH